LSQFAAHGVASEQIEMRGPSPYPQLLEEYGDIDIALDTYPYNGGATSADALWMGVPVITLAGERMISRQTAAMLHCVGLDSFVAENPARYLKSLYAAPRSETASPKFAPVSARQCRPRLWATQAFSHNALRTVYARSGGVGAPECSADVGSGARATPPHRQSTPTSKGAARIPDTPPFVQIDRHSPTDASQAVKEKPQFFLDRPGNPLNPDWPATCAP
jgi:Glycosyl transferase family 41